MRYKNRKLTLIIKGISWKVYRVNIECNTVYASEKCDAPRLKNGKYFAFICKKKDYFY